MPRISHRTFCSPPSSLTRLRLKLHNHLRRDTAIYASAMPASSVSTTRCTLCHPEQIIAIIPTSTPPLQPVTVQDHLLHKTRRRHHHHHRCRHRYRCHYRCRRCYRRRYRCRCRCRRRRCVIAAAAHAYVSPLLPAHFTNMHTPCRPTQRTAPTHIKITDAVDTLGCLV